MFRLGESLTVNFVDYAAAFDSVNHKFLDKTLIRAGASNKMRAIVRVVYNSAAVFTTVPDADGKVNVSKISRGVLQGDILSPLFFILALEYILRMHDTAHSKGVNLGGSRIHTLGYADDLTLTDNGNGNATGIASASERATSIAAGSRERADMQRKRMGATTRQKTRSSASKVDSQTRQ